MLIIKAFHIIAMVAWFAGLFYLPRLFVYHSECSQQDSLIFKTMEWRLYYCIMWPTAILTTCLGLILILYNPFYYLHAGWMHAKLGLVFFLWIYHLACGHFRLGLAKGKNNKTSLFFRIFNEISILFLIGIVLLAVVKPF